MEWEDDWRAGVCLFLELHTTLSDSYSNATSMDLPYGGSVITTATTILISGDVGDTLS